MTGIEDFPETVATRPLWLITLADLALLLVGFFVLLQANQQIDRTALASGIRTAFGAEPVAADPLPVAASGVGGFAVGSAVIPAGGMPQALIAWARDAALDPRVSLRITGSVDGTTADVDPATGSGAVLAADRARAVATLLAGAAPGRIVILTAERPSRRQVIVTQSFTGDQP